ncbi:MAG TPA: DUF3592 domain-containing protein [Myxococcus sp.]|nr:DUF3592 domain-containing protein [Myxococcus sp.]
MLSRVATSAVLLLFLLPWTAVTMGFNALIGSGLVRQARSADWPSVPGTILRSEVETSRGSKSTTYGLKVLYAWSVGGERYEGTRYHVNAWRSGDRAHGEALVERFPAGATVPVYYLPEKPSEAVLMPGVQGAELFTLMFMVPFNLVTLWLGSVLVGIWRRNTPLRAFSREDGSECVTLGDASPAGSAGVALGVSALVCVVFGGVTVGINPAVPLAVGAWCAVIGIGALFGLMTRARLRAGHYDLRVNVQARSVSLPPVAGRKARLDVAWQDIHSLSVETHVTHGSKGRSTTRYRPTLVLSGPDGKPRREVIDAMQSEETAHSVADWLRSHLEYGNSGSARLHSA